MNINKKILLRIKRTLVIGALISNVLIFATNNTQIKAVGLQDTKINYKYDNLGRVSYAVYPDGTKITYEYDDNGNILKVSREKIDNTQDGDSSSDEKDNTGNGSESDNGNKPDNSDNISDSNTSQDGNGGSENSNNNNSVNNNSGNNNPESTDNNDNKDKKTIYTADYLKNLNIFKNSKPTIISSKRIKKKTIKLVLKASKKDKGGLTVGYQVRYSDNKKFKKSKTVTLKSKGKNKKTTRKINVKNKTIYIKVRAYTKRLDGKKVYSKYTKYVTVKKK